MESKMHQMLWFQINKYTIAFWNQLKILVFQRVEIASLETEIAPQIS